jgi:uncharacterized membrane protein (DUF485 family)
MTASRQERNGIWTQIEAERQRDRTLRRVATIAWSVTAIVLLIYATFVGLQVVQGIRMLQVGVMSRVQFAGMVMPFVTAFGLVSLLIAVLATVGVFLRLRTASLQEIQLRLTALEEMLAAKGDGA